jgi:hypothetical protein
MGDHARSYTKEDLMAKLDYLTLVERVEDFVVCLDSDRRKRAKGRTPQEAVRNWFYTHKSHALAGRCFKVIVTPVEPTDEPKDEAEGQQYESE